MYMELLVKPDINVCVYVCVYIYIYIYIYIYERDFVLGILLLEL
jgi:hypothetical protein